MPPKTPGVKQRRGVQLCEYTSDSQAIFRAASKPLHPHPAVFFHCAKNNRSWGEKMWKRASQRRRIIKTDMEAVFVSFRTFSVSPDTLPPPLFLHFLSHPPPPNTHTHMQCNHHQPAPLLWEQTLIAHDHHDYMEIWIMHKGRLASAVGTKPCGWYSPFKLYGKYPLSINNIIIYSTMLFSSVLLFHRFVIC